MSNEPAISLERVTLSFGNKVIVSDFSAEIASGESVSIVGRSGSGKTTLLRAIAGLHTPESGRVHIDGEAPERLYGTGRVQFLHQRPVLFDHLTVAGNIALSVKLAHQPQLSAVETRVLLETMGLTGSELKYPFELSEGMKARLALVRAFVTNPKLLLVDEPFAALDFLRRESLNRQLLVLAEKRSTTVIVVTHDLSDALRFTSTAIVFSSYGTSPLRLPLPGKDPALDPNALPPVYLLARDALRHRIEGQRATEAASA